MQIIYFIFLHLPLYIHVNVYINQIPHTYTQIETFYYNIDTDNACKIVKTEHFKTNFTMYKTYNKTYGNMCISTMKTLKHVHIKKGQIFKNPKHLT